MHPLVRGAAAAAVFTVLGNLEPPPREPPPVVSAPARAAKGLDGMPAPCGLNTLPEGPVCLPLPVAGGAPRPGEREHHPREALVERIPRRPDRSEVPGKYLYPTDGPAAHAPTRVLGGYPDVPSPGSAWPMGEGIELAASPHQEVIALGLEHQVGDMRVIFRGELYGPTIALAHEIKDGARTRTVIAIYGYLESPSPAVTVGATVAPGNVLGAASDSGVAALSHIYYETREARATSKLEGMDAKRLQDSALSVPIDPRNVLPLRP